MADTPAKTPNGSCEPPSNDGAPVIRKVSPDEVRALLEEGRVLQAKVREMVEPLLAIGDRELNLVLR